MGKVRDETSKIDFESSPSHTVTYDPETETQTRNGRNGDYKIVPVIENGVTVDLSLSNQSLLRQLRMITTPSVLRITRSGTSYDTKYAVENLGPPAQQAKMT